MEHWLFSFLPLEKWWQNATKQQPHAQWLPFLLGCPHNDNNKLVLEHVAWEHASMDRLQVVTRMDANNNNNNTYGVEGWGLRLSLEPQQQETAKPASDDALWSRVSQVRLYDVRVVIVSDNNDNNNNKEATTTTAATSWTLVCDTLEWNRQTDDQCCCQWKFTNWALWQGDDRILVKCSSSMGSGIMEPSTIQTTNGSSPLQKNGHPFLNTTNIVGSLSGEWIIHCNEFSKAWPSIARTLFVASEALQPVVSLQLPYIQLLIDILPHGAKSTTTIRLDPCVLNLSPTTCQLQGRGGAVTINGVRCLDCVQSIWKWDLKRSHFVVGPPVSVKENMCPNEKPLVRCQWNTTFDNRTQHDLLWQGLQCFVQRLLLGAEQPSGLLLWPSIRVHGAMTVSVTETTNDDNNHTACPGWFLRVNDLSLGSVESGGVCCVVANIANARFESLGGAGANFQCRRLFFDPEQALDSVALVLYRFVVHKLGLWNDCEGLAIDVPHCRVILRESKPILKAVETQFSIAPQNVTLQCNYLEWDIGQGSVSGDARDVQYQSSSGLTIGTLSSTVSNMEDFFCFGLARCCGRAKLEVSDLSLKHVAKQTVCEQEDSSRFGDLCAQKVRIDFCDHGVEAQSLLPLGFRFVASDTKLSIKNLSELVLRLDSATGGDWVEARVKSLFANFSDEFKPVVVEVSRAHIASGHGHISVPFLRKQRESLRVDGTIDVSMQSLEDGYGLIGAIQRFFKEAETNLDVLLRHLELPGLLVQLEEEELNLEFGDLKFGANKLSADRLGLRNLSGGTLSASGIDLLQDDHGQYTASLSFIDSFYIPGAAYLTKPTSDVVVRLSHENGLVCEATDVATALLDGYCGRNFAVVVLGIPWKTIFTARKMTVDSSDSNNRTITLQSLQFEVNQNSFSLAFESAACGTVSLHQTSCVGTIVDEDTIRDLAIRPSVVVLDATLSSIELSDVLEKRNKKSQTLNLPFCRMESFTAEASFQGAGIITTRSVLNFPGFDGTECTTSDDLMSFLARNVMRKAPGIYDNTRVLGERATDLTFKAAGRLAGSSVIGSTVKSVGALVFVDSIRKVLYVGKITRGKSRDQSASWKDFACGVQEAARLTAMNGGLLRRGQSEPYTYAVGDFATGLSDQVGKYLDSNSIRLGSAGLSVVGLAFGGYIYGFCGMLLGQYVGGKAGARVFSKSKQMQAEAHTATQIEETEENDDWVVVRPNFASTDELRELTIPVGTSAARKKITRSLSW